ncbi:hypothetical protein H920_04719 [Fukomys damarensis]|uniref:Uncharacterized protein n=1 Tax=Fukomys damarensis TaxID=885580 RepID=A0A091DU10_FUKDA|nr:hypothetical protein H920_04719 [Fukomys damarensis]
MPLPQGRARFNPSIHMIRKRQEVPVHKLHGRQLGVGGGQLPQMQETVENTMVVFVKKHHEDTCTTHDALQHCITEHYEGGENASYG